MCFSKPKAPDPSEDLRKEEEARQAKIRTGTGQINEAFSRFDEPYFKNIGDVYRGYYRPQLDEQTTGAKRALTFRFAKNADSSAAGRTQADFERDRIRAGQQLESGALDAESNARKEVEQNRSNQINLLEAGGSLENVANQSNALAKRDIGVPSFSPIGDLFGKYTNMLAQSTRMGDQGYQQPAFFQKQTDFLRGKGSSRVVGG